MINSFWHQLRQFGILRIFLSLDFLVPVAFVFGLERLTIEIESYGIDFGQVLDVLVGLFAFVFAALAILIALSETSFSKKLMKEGVYDGLLFHYWYTCNVYIISISYVLLISLAQLHDKYFEVLAIFLVAYSLCLTLSLVKVTISAGIYKARID